MPLIIANFEPAAFTVELSVWWGIGLAVATLSAHSWTWYQKLVQWLLRMLGRLVYRIRVHGWENWPEQDGAVIVANHNTWIDGFLILIFAPRRTRMIAWSGNFGNRAMLLLARFCEVILISGGPKSIRRGLEQATQALKNGDIVGIFPEGGLSRTGQIQSFKPGLMRVLGDSGAPVIPIYIDQTWGSIFSYSGGKSVWKWPRTFRRPVTIHIGQPIKQPDSTFTVRQSLQALGATVVPKRQGPWVTPARSFVRRCRKRLFHFKAADSAGTQSTGGSLLMRSLILRRLLRKHVLSADEKNVGILIPPSFGGVATNMALALDQRTAVNLNYTVSNAIMNTCVAKAGIRHVLSSRKVMEKFDFQFECEVFCLEDLRDKVALSDKLIGAAMAYALPARLTEWLLGLHRAAPDDLLTIIFTSGSTGTPKGVMLTNQNIASNVEAIDQVICLNRRDVLIGILPFFHSFGYTITLWGTMALDIAGAYHFSPLDAQQIGRLCEKYNVTLLLSTPTFLRSYLRRCTKQQFQTLDVVVAGAEKLPVELCDAFESKFGVRPVEGYGATELSPLVSVNVPPSRHGDNFQVDCKEGTVGRPVPNVAAKVTHVDTGELLGQDLAGSLWITGPNVMKGYLDQPEKTAEVIVDGWYNTGDVALIDEDGFIRITGRISRFSKIGGEMVPHLQVEEALSQLLDDDEQDEPRFAVTAVPDPKKGERLVVLHTQLKKAPADYCQGLTEAGLPNIYIPSTNSFFQVEQLPLLGSGKLDLKLMQKMAQEIVAGGR